MAVIRQSRDESYHLQTDLLDKMSYIYQVYLSICIIIFPDFSHSFRWRPHSSAASISFFVHPRVGDYTQVVGISYEPQAYLFISTPSVHLLAGILVSLAISSFLVAYQLHHQHNNHGLARKLAAISGSPFTLAGAMSMSAGQSWANQAIAESGATDGSLSESYTPAMHANRGTTNLSAAPSKEEMMRHLAQYTYTLDWSGKVVEHS
jgi:hypothetical protein